jgi:hypothetical protein
MFPGIAITLRCSCRLAAVHPAPTILHRPVATRFPAPPRMRFLSPGPKPAFARLTARRAACDARDFALLAGDVGTVHRLPHAVAKAVVVMLIAGRQEGGEIYAPA